MLYFEKSQPAPANLLASGDFRHPDVLERLKEDFKNKCYLCEQKEPTDINVEHLRPHRGNLVLKRDWNNLFWSCAHCNNIKSDNFENILDCTSTTSLINEKLKYFLKPIPKELVQIEALDGGVDTSETKELLLDIYNGTTPLKVIESAHLRNKLLKSIKKFQDYLIKYEDTDSPGLRNFYELNIISEISKSSDFTAFKRWIILDSEYFRPIFEPHFD